LNFIPQSAFSKRLCQYTNLDKQGITELGDESKLYPNWATNAAAPNDVTANGIPLLKGDNKLEQLGKDKLVKSWCIPGEKLFLTQETPI